MSNSLKEGQVVLEPAESSTRHSLSLAIKAGIIVILMVAIYYPTFIWMWQRWFAADSYYAHGPLIPVVSGVLIWLKRKEIAEASIESSKLGLGLLIAGLILYIISAFTRIYFTSAYSFFIVLMGLALYLLGWKFTRVIIFPLCFIIFMIPAPMAVVAAATLKMKLLAAQASVSVIQLFGIPVIREGSMVYMPNTSTVVGDPCSGLRSLISLSALGILYVYIVKASYLRKSLLFLSTIPIALLANMIRTTATLLIANSYGDEIITNNFLHTGFGLMVFVIAFVGMFSVGKVLGCRISQKD